MMRRRAFLAAMAAVLAWPRGGRALGAPARIGFLYAGHRGSAGFAAQVAEINEGMRENDLVEGRDYVFEFRAADGSYDRLPELAKELANAGVRMILANTAAAVRAAQAIDPPIPVVMIGINDPVGVGLIESLARPGGHTTGTATLVEDLTPKMLEFQQMLLPNATKVGVITNPANPTNAPMAAGLDARARAMGMTALTVQLRAPDGFDAVLTELAAAGLHALHLVSDSGNLDLGDRISAFAIEHKIPFFATYPPICDVGGLLGYGPVRRQMLTRGGYYVRRILDGSNPADLPVEQPVQIELAINLKTAKQIGLDVPFRLQQIAERIVE